MTTGVAVVTGGTAGVGRATSVALARAGYDVAVLARDTGRLAATAADVERLGRRVLPLRVDVADAQAVDDAAERVETELGEIDVWVNNAMVSVLAPFAECSAAEFRRVTEVTYLGYVHGTMSALRRMVPRDRGTVVQVGSALAHRAIPLQSAYCGAKHAIRGFTESVRCELAHDRSAVRVSMVQLPALNTPQFQWVRTVLARQPRPVPPIYQPELAAAAVLWAVRHRPREVSLGASTAAAILAQKVAPGLLDRYLARTGYDAQQADTPLPGDRPDNLWDAPDRDVGAHGMYDADARGWSLHWWCRSNARPLAVTVAGFMAAGAAARRRGTG